MDTIKSDSPNTVDELAMELATIKQSAKRIAIIGSRNLPITHQQMIETLATALVRQGNIIITSGGSSGTNAAAIRGAMKANPDKLKVILPQTIGQQPSDVQDQLIGVPNIVEHADRAMMTLADASRVCNREIIAIPIASIIACAHAVPNSEYLNALLKIRRPTIVVLLFGPPPVIM